MSVLLGTLVFKLKGVPALPVKYFQIIYDIIQVACLGGKGGETLANKYSMSLGCFVWVDGASSSVGGLCCESI